MPDILIIYIIVGGIYCSYWVFRFYLTPEHRPLWLWPVMIVLWPIFLVGQITGYLKND